MKGGIEGWRGLGGSVGNEGGGGGRVERVHGPL